MSKKALSLVLYAHQEYMHHVDDESSSQWHKSLFPMISEMYLPLLAAFAKMEEDAVPFNVSIVITPILCSLLSDPVVQERYVEWLDRMIQFGEKEVARYESKPQLKKIALTYLEKQKKNKIDYTETYKCDLLSKFVYYAKRGDVELLGTTATPIFLPHFADLKEACMAQIEAGLISHKHAFGSKPDGFWLPYMGWTPGLERYIRMYGYNYSIIDTHGFLFGTPSPEKGIFSPARTKNYLALFARDNDSPIDLSGEKGFFTNPVYRNNERDIGYEAASSMLGDVLYEDGIRFDTGYKYWSQESGMNGDTIYDYEKANLQAKKDAKDFLDEKAYKLSCAQKIVESDVSLTETFYLQDFSHNWYESVIWLEEVFRQAAVRSDIELECCSSLVGNQYKLPRIAPCISAATPKGYGDELLDSSNSWMLKYVRKATKRMIDLGTRFSENTGLKARTLNLAAKEVLLAQAADWPKQVHLGNDAWFAEKRFRMSIENFSVVFESLGANAISTEWLTRIEREDALFEWMNYRIFSPKR